MTTSRLFHRSATGVWHPTGLSLPGLLAGLAIVACVGLAWPSQAEAIPRFAARNGMECIQCHVNPTGGGARNAYGAEIFEQTWLPIGGNDLLDPKALMEPRLDPSSDPAPKKAATFAGRITDTMRIGGDFRTAFIFIRPDEGPEPGSDPEVTSSFFVMQGDIYHVAELHPRLTLSLDVGLYSGFEAWALIDLLNDVEDMDLLLKVGRFVPPIGIREVEHQLFTRDGVGLGAVDRDTGLELTMFLGPFTWHLALLNGTLGDTALDASGTERTTFEKAVATRGAIGFELGPLRTQLGASLYYNDNVNQPNPLFLSELPPELLASASEGVNELRTGPFWSMNLGRFTYMGDLVYVSDTFTSPTLGEISGFALYQELSFVAIQGVEIILTHEFKDADTEVLGNVTHRAGLIVEVFPLPYSEVRLMTRRTWSESFSDNGVTDLVVFLHAFM